jgi:hypothetical protein
VLPNLSWESYGRGPSIKEFCLVLGYFLRIEGKSQGVGMARVPLFSGRQSPRSK